MNLFEGGNAKAKNGAEATKVDIKSLNDKLYESFKKDIVKLVLSVNDKFNKTYGEPLFPSTDIVTNFKVFSGSGNTFFKKSKKEVH